MRAFASALVVVLLGLVSLGCSDSRRSPSALQPIEGVPAQAVLYGSPDDQDQQRRAIQVVLKGFEQDEGLPTMPVDILVHPGRSFTAPNGIQARGCYKGRGGTGPIDRSIGVAQGEGQEANLLPALYHELAHRNYSVLSGRGYGHVDAGHTDPKWATWDMRGLFWSALSKK